MLKTGTWNTNSLFAFHGKVVPSKSHNINNEMKRMISNILEMSARKCLETIPDGPEPGTNNEPHHYNGVAILINKKSSRSVRSFVGIFDGVVLLQLKYFPEAQILFKFMHQLTINRKSK